MAKLSGVELKSIKYATGMEGGFFQGNVYLDGKKIGFYSEDGNGGPGWFTEDKDGAEDTLIERIHKHFVKHPEVDTISIYRSKMTAPEYAEKRDAGALPMNDFSKEDASFALDVFMGNLFKLHEDEKSFKKAIKQGYKAYVSVEYVGIVNAPVPLDEGFLTDGSEKTLEQIKAQANKKSLANEVTVYSSADDFVIQ